MQLYEGQNTVKIDVSSFSPELRAMSYEAGRTLSELRRGGGEGNQSCKIAKCSMQHGRVEYCNQCQEFPCDK